MRFAGVNYLAVVIAAVVAWLAGAGWYMAFGKRWMAALGLTPEKMEEAKRQPGAYRPVVYAFIGNLRMALGLAGRPFPLGPLSLRAGGISAALCWVGFVITTMWVNNSFARRDGRLLVIDGGYWLVALLLMGAIIGAMG